MAARSGPVAKAAQAPEVCGSWLEQVLDQLRPGDTLVVWKLDRLSR